MGDNIPGGNFLGGNFPRTIFFFSTDHLMVKMSNSFVYKYFSRHRFLDICRCAFIVLHIPMLQKSVPDWFCYLHIVTANENKWGVYGGKVFLQNNEAFKVRR